MCEGREKRRKWCTVVSAGENETGVSYCNQIAITIEVSRCNQIYYSLKDTVKRKCSKRASGIPALMKTSYCCSRVYRYYCESCEQAICRECTMTSHSTERHKYTQLTDTIDKQTQTITQLADKLKRKVPVVTQSTKDVEEVTCRLEARAEVAKSEIQKCFPRILKALQDREKSMMAEVESMVQRKSKVLGLQQERLENELKRLTTTCNFTGEFNFFLAIGPQTVFKKNPS